MTKFLCFILSVVLIGCTTTPTYTGKAIVKLDLPPRPSLDLSSYKTEYRYVDQNNVCMSLDALRREATLHKILKDRLILDELYIEAYKKYYESTSK